MLKALFAAFLATAALSAEEATPKKPILLLSEETSETCPDCNDTSALACPDCKLVDESDEETAIN